MMSKKQQTPKEVFKPEIYIGIDPGVNTGVAVWSVKEQRFWGISTSGIIRAMFEINSNLFILADHKSKIHFIIEDARKRKGDAGLTDEKKQGAGSIKRDSAIWQEFCEYYDFAYTLKAPNGKLNAIAKNREMWERQTGYTKQTSEHARCAAMLIWKL